DGSLDLNPEYQRAVVWPEKKQVGLVDSVLRSFHIPPLIFGIWPRCLVSVHCG
ncbi:hypothetical protein K488DRAFT_52980, partial [Vararia minispora EC-137]